MGRYVLLSVLVVVMILFQTALYLVMMGRAEKQKRDFVLTRDIFVESVNEAVTNFLSRLVPDPEPVRQVHSTFDFPSVVLVQSLSTWQGYYGSSGCLVDGVRYSEGDYCPYGLVRLIESGKVYCSSTNGIVILRERPAVPTARSWSAAAPQNDGAL